MTDLPPDPACDILIVVPTLNEAATIGPVLAQILPFAEAEQGLIVVSDGGSRDGTREIVARIATQNPHVVLLDNPVRIQSAGFNRAVALYGQAATYVIRVDAHCRYPDSFCADLLAEARRTGADSVVVSMVAEGAGVTQAATAAAQNSAIGNGGSRHRMRVGDGAFVEHGHHALMRVRAFCAVGGYDESFACNEDAELDIRLLQAGYHIWLTARTGVAYYPRKTLGALFRQYFRYGRGRAQNVMKHAMRPKLRQAVLLGVVPALALAGLAAVHPVFALPALLLLAACLAAGTAIAATLSNPAMVLAGVSAVVMHVSWSLGFWREVMARMMRRRLA